MLSFFRRIRKTLLYSSNAHKYILYALGEIALVVIGILIALQINNWNEWRKDRLTEKEVLKGFIKSGTTRKYIFYAIGEFVLIVAGILVAMQINDWNEERKMRQSGKQYTGTFPIQ